MFVFVAIFAYAGLLSAEEKVELEGTVFGNREAPKATYIVPWRPLVPSEVKGLQISTLLNEELELLDPELFKRQVELYKLENK